MTDDLSDARSRIALSVKHAYCFHIKWARQLESFSPPDAKYGKYWDAAAEICLNNRIDPCDYVEVLFGAMKPRWPEITQMGSDWALSMYVKYAKELAHRYVVDVKVQMDAFERLKHIGKDLKSILVENEDGFDPLFIFIVATLNGLTDIAASHKAAALTQYLSSVHYDQLYSIAIPAEFKEQAKAIGRGI